MAIHFVITMHAQMKMAFCSAFGDCIYVLLVIQNLQQLRQQTAGPSKSRLVDGPLAVVLHLLIPRHDVHWALLVQERHSSQTQRILQLRAMLLKHRLM